SFGFFSGAKPLKIAVGPADLSLRDIGNPGECIPCLIGFPPQLQPLKCPSALRLPVRCPRIAWELPETGLPALHCFCPVPAPLCDGGQPDKASGLVRFFSREDEKYFLGFRMAPQSHESRTARIPPPERPRIAGELPET